MARGGDEGVGDASAGDQPIDPLRERFQHPQLGRDLRAADDRHERARGLREGLAERFELGGEERTGASRRREAGDAAGRGMGAVRGAEGVHHVHVAQRRHPPRQRLVVRLLAREEAHVLAEHDLAGLDVDASAIQPVHGEPDLAPEQLAEAPCHRREGEFGGRLPFLRAPEVRRHHDPRPGLRGLLQRRQRGPDAGVARHRAVPDRGVQVLADEHPPPREVEVGHDRDVHGAGSPDPCLFRRTGRRGPYLRQPAFTSATVVSSIRFKNPHLFSISPGKRQPYRHGTSSRIPAAPAPRRLEGLAATASEAAETRERTCAGVCPDCRWRRATHLSVCPYRINSR